MIRISLKGLTGRFFQLGQVQHQPRDTSFPHDKIQVGHDQTSQFPNPLSFAKQSQGPILNVKEL